MKKIIKRAFVWFGLSLLMMIFWIIGLFIGNAIFPSSLMEMSVDSNSNAELMLFLTCALNTAVILYFIYNSRIKGWKLVGVLFLVTFGIQYFMSQIETLWFNDSLDFPIKGIWAIVTGGAIMTLLFAIMATWLTGNFSPIKEYKNGKVKINLASMLKWVILLSVIIWPLVYFMAGYLIAWQFAEVRLFYSETTEMDSFLSIMEGNVASGLYFFQIFRGVLWILIAYLVIVATEGSLIHKGIILGLLLSFLGSSQLLLPNPFMTHTVRMAHLAETASSSFLWGLILVWCFGKLPSNKKTGINTNIEIAL
ncbi:MAG: hypothetical protein KAI29_05135 [Cyclobacteriaceae bacterium]|nr:hypothetical protein [Cyclobacteriaceae bacterium]